MQNGIGLTEFWPLPLRVKVAFTLRSARRVQQFFVLPADEAERDAHQAAYDAAMELAQAYCEGRCQASAEEARSIARAAYAMAEATHMATHFSGYGAAHAAQAVAMALLVQKEPNVQDHGLELLASSFSSCRVVLNNAPPFAFELLEATLRRELDNALALNVGTAPTPGPVIDPSENGPLGSLWPLGKPMGYE